jgi:ketosteroid isomerase-like protein
MSDSIPTIRRYEGANMSDVENRLKHIEDRTAIKDVLLQYCMAVDSLSDMEGLLGCFTEDADFDLSGLNLPRFKGHAGIRGFFAQVFADMTHHAHFVTNFRLDRLERDEAKCQAYIMGMGKARTGLDVLVYVRYNLALVRTAKGWKISSFDERPLMPMPESLTAIHGRD